MSSRTSDRVMHSRQSTITRREEVAPDHYLIELECPVVAGAARPGQFVHVRVCGTHDPLLRRPISIMLRDSERGRIQLLVRSAGRGTEMLAEACPGDSLDVLGPLGNGFAMPEPGRSPILVAGGVGVAPLIFLADELKHSSPAGHVRGLFGAATEDALACWTEFAGRCDEFHAATEDGSAGEQGLVTDLLPGLLSRADASVVYTCGPRMMMAKVAELCAAGGVPCRVSMEQFMGCGIGACLGCAIATRGQPRYQRVCTDGPVFDARKIAWEELATGSNA